MLAVMKRFIILTAALFAAVLLAGAAYLGWLAWQRFNVPVYTFAQQITPDGKFANSYLSSNGVSYVTTRGEFSLELLPSAFGYPLIGRTTDDQEVRAVPGNDNYISYSGFMNPVVIFRKESIPPVDLAALPIHEMVYTAIDDTQHVRKSTQDAQLIGEVVQAMQAAPVSLPKTERIYHIALHSPNLPGLVYSIYVLIEPSGAVYFAPLYDTQHGVPAGPLFTQWVRQQP